MMTTGSRSPCGPMDKKSESVPNKSPTSHQSESLSTSDLGSGWNFPSSSIEPHCSSPIATVAVAGSSCSFHKGASSRLVLAGRRPNRSLTIPSQHLTPAQYLDQHKQVETRIAHKKNTCIEGGEKYPHHFRGGASEKKFAQPFSLLAGIWKRSLKIKDFLAPGAAETRSSSLRDFPNFCTSKPENHHALDQQRIRRSGETPNQETSTVVFFTEHVRKLCKKRGSINILVLSLLILSGMQIYSVLHDLAPTITRQQEGYSNNYVRNIREAADSLSAEANFTGRQSHNDSVMDSSTSTRNRNTEKSHRKPPRTPMIGYGVDIESNRLDSAGAAVEAEEKDRNQDVGTERSAAAGSVPVLVDTKESDAVPIPEVYANLADFASEPSAAFTPIFWHIPKSGGSSVKDVIGGCMGLTLASEVGGAFERENVDSLEVVNIRGSSFVNVDTTKIGGIERAKRLGLASSGLADVIVSLHPFQASTLFTSKHKGMMFAIFRNPVDRVVSTFNYRSMATWEPTYDPSLKTMSIQDFVREGKITDNWMTRILSNEGVAEINDDHLATAKEILRTKILVGLLDKAVDSFRRFHTYFGWEPKGKVPLHDRLGCVKDLLLNGANRSNRTVSVEEGSDAYQLLLEFNKFDYELYKYAVGIFENSQAKFFEDF